MIPANTKQPDVKRARNVGLNLETTIEEGIEVVRFLEAHGVVVDDVLIDGFVSEYDAAGRLTGVRFLQRQRGADGKTLYDANGKGAFTERTVRDSALHAALDQEGIE